MAVLSLKNLIKSFDGKRVVNSVSMNIASSQVVGLLGPNGAGKTTTFYMAVGMLKPDSGRIFLNEEDVTGFPIHVRARKGIGYLPQETSIFRKLTVRENLMAILEHQSLSRSEQESRAEKLLDELGIKHLSQQKAVLLSGGEKRRLEISRALSTNPSFILLDEPFAGIDPLAVIDIKAIIEHLKELGIGVLISDHNVRETLGVCDEAFILSCGEIIETGTPQQIASSEVCRRIYLGNEFTL
ncbi:MAG: LPS export ABC transporter ATP-binding protein [Deltaproteobacteria bacterium]|nr:LPS export ABC transporter ATP-binding protein [Deltaproteobacteria bacterium]